MRESRSSGSVEGVMSNRDPYSDQNQFFLRETRDGFEAFSGADQSRAQFFSVHRRPLTGSTAGVTPVVKGAG
jgi:hypothetical protein